MIAESFEKKDEAACDDDEGKKADIRDLKTLVMLSIATSIDALAVGLSYSVLGSAIWGPAAIIGAVTFILCLLGTEFGRRIGAKFERWATLIGGIVLVGIGAKIAIEHVMKCL
jgi:manganese efflux pump family protein